MRAIDPEEQRQRNLARCHNPPPGHYPGKHGKNFKKNQKKRYKQALAQLRKALKPNG